MDIYGCFALMDINMVEWGWSRMGLCGKWEVDTKYKYIKKYLSSLCRGKKVLAHANYSCFFLSCVFRVCLVCGGLEFIPLGNVDVENVIHRFHGTEQITVAIIGVDRYERQRRPCFNTLNH
jgi:hypothetical protein